jgi:hypothetical protein
MVNKFIYIFCAYNLLKIYKSQYIFNIENILIIPLKSK